MALDQGGACAATSSRDRGGESGGAAPDHDDVVVHPVSAYDGFPR
jgi:hypothetical protein